VDRSVKSFASDAWGPTEPAGAAAGRAVRRREVSRPAGRAA